jgi:hypothetical protein
LLAAIEHFNLVASDSFTPFLGDGRPFFRFTYFPYVRGRFWFAGQTLAYIFAMRLGFGFIFHKFTNTFYTTKPSTTSLQITLLCFKLLTTV